ncbi:MULTISPECIES: HEAT repeat domain-containing protein [Thermus]|uniref:HEAT repeat domain-containing protein n=1 Tax=Thermus TaxID=270 RepID=UPI001F1C6DE9|nr:MULTISPECIES: HEAT repeat domain-containing protein [Thermus]
MWRSGEGLYALVVFLVVLLEALALGYLVFAFTARLFGLLGYGETVGALLLGLAPTGLALVLLGAYVLLYHAYTAWREGEEERLRERYLEGFAQALLAGENLPPPPWPKEAFAALLALRESLEGELAQALLPWLRLGLPRWRRALTSPFASRARRLEALDALAQARLPEAFPLVLPYLAHPDPVLRLAAARAGARLVGEEDLEAFAEALLRAALPRGALLEVLLLLEDRAEPVARRFLQAGGEEEAWAALEALGRLKLHGLAEAVLGFLRHPDPEVRAAAMRALWRLEYPPLGHEEAVLAALGAEEEFLRLQAVRLLPLLGGALARRALWKALSDPSFYVRRGAAEALRALDPALLKQAAEAHPDPYGRAMARQVAGA